MKRHSGVSFFQDKAQLRLYVTELLNFSLGENDITQYKGDELKEKLSGFWESKHVLPKEFGVKFVAYFLSQHPEFQDVPKTSSLYDHYKHEKLENSGLGAISYQFFKDAGIAQDAGLSFDEWHATIISRKGRKQPVSDQPDEAPRRAGKNRPPKADAMDLKVEKAEAYKVSFKLFMAKLVKLNHPDKFDMVPDAVRKRLFGSLSVHDHILDKGLNANLNPKISNLYVICQKALVGNGKKGTVIPSMVKLMGYDPQTGAVLAGGEKAHVPRPGKEKPVMKEAVPEPEDKDKSEMLKIVDASLGSMVSAVKESAGVVDCGKSHEEIYKTLSGTPVGSSLVLFLSYAPDRIFSRALEEMGYVVEGNHDKPVFHPITGMETDGTHLAVIRRVEEKCNAAPILLANRLEKTPVVIGEMHRLLDMASSTAKTNGEVSLLHDIVDKMISLIKVTKQKKMQDISFLAFAKIDGKEPSMAIDPAMQAMALRIIDNPAVRKIALARQRKEQYRLIQKLTASKR